MIAKPTIARLSLYRRVLSRHKDLGESYIFSHELAQLANRSAAQIRRDLMAIGFSGTPSRGYKIIELIEHINKVLDSPSGEAVALVGIGNLGRAILSYLPARHTGLAIVAAFDSDPAKVDRIIHGCRCYPIEMMDSKIKELKIDIGLIAVPAPAAQEVANRLVRAGLRGILNFAPTPLRLPPSIYLEEVDMTVSLEKTAYFSRKSL